MQVTKCDICKKEIKKETEHVSVSCEGYLLYKHFELCGNCSKPFSKLLKSKKLIKDENKK